MDRVAVTGGSGFIGTNLIEFLSLRSDIEILNLDIKPPQEASGKKYWTKCDLLNPEDIYRNLREFRPNKVVHLGGRTDMLGTTLQDYAANHIGTANLISALQQISAVERVIFTSTQFVVGPGPLPLHDLDFRPHTIYGQSKVESEKTVRGADLDCIWTIIRPTNIWGKGHPRYPYEFWRVLKQGRYFHPGGKRVRRSYGYVGTIIQQIDTILKSPPELIDREVFYVGDPPMDLLEWTNAFALELTNHSVHVVPRPMLKAIAKIGDIVVRAGGKFPIFSSRYRSMTEDYVTPMEKTFERLGRPNITLEQGVKETVAWLRTTDPFWQQ